MTTYKVGELVEYFCGVCKDWVEAKVLETQYHTDFSRIVVSHITVGGYNSITLYDDEIEKYVRKGAVR